MANKKTKKDLYMEMVEIFQELGKGEYVDFCNHQIELLDKKSTGSKGLTKIQKENEIIKNIVLEELAKYQGENGITATELLKQSNGIGKLDINTDEMTINGYEIIQEQVFELANKINKLIDEINNLKENN